MADPYTDIPELSAQQAGIARRRKIAEAMQAQAMQPLQSQQLPGGYVVPTSPLLGIGKVLEAYLAKKGLDAADTAESGLANKATGMMSAERQKVADAMSMQQEQPRTTPDMAGPMPGQAPTIDTQSQRLSGLNLQFPQAIEQRKEQQGYIEKARTREDAQAAAKLLAEQAALDRANTAEIAAKGREDAAKIAAAAKLQSDRERREMMLLLANNKQEAAEDKAQTKLNADLDKKTNAAKIASKSFDDLIFKIDQLVDKDGNPLPGFTSAFGQIDAMYPNFMKFDKTSKAYKNLESIQAQETMRGLADAKEQVGQSFGSMQVKEWDRFTNLVRSLDPSQPDKSSLLPNLINLRNEAIKEKEALQSQIGSNQPIVPSAPSAAPKEEVWVRDKNGKLVKQ